MVQTLFQLPPEAASPKSLINGPKAAAARKGSRNMTSERNSETTTKALCPDNKLMALFGKGRSSICGITLMLFFPAGGAGASPPIAPEGGPDGKPPGGPDGNSPGSMGKG